MNHQSIFLKHRFFNNELNNELELLINCSANSLSYAIANKANGDILALFNTQNQENFIDILKEELQNRKELQQHFKEVQICFAGGNDILVPEAVANNTQQQWINNFVTPVKGSSFIPTEATNGFVPIIEIPDQLERTLQASGFNTIHYHHSVKPFLNTHSTALHIDFKGKSAYFVYIKDQQLQFQKSFEVTNSDEFNYFILLLKDQLALEPSTPIYLSGLIEEDSLYVARLAKYFSSINFFKIEGIHFNDTLQDKFAAHYFTTLIALSSCVSLAEN